MQYKLRHTFLCDHLVQSGENNQLNNFLLQGSGLYSSHNHVTRAYYMLLI